MANTEGGEVSIKTLQTDKETLDSARLDDLVNKYVAPRVQGITSAQGDSGDWHIAVPQSKERPHIFVEEARYRDRDGKVRSAFYPGQIYVRHSSKTEPATDDDLRNIILDHVGRWLKKVGEAVTDFSLEIGEGTTGLPVRISESAAALTIAFKDPNRDYPYTTKTLGAKIGKGQNWVAQAASVLRLKEDPRYSLAILGAGDNVVVRRYNDRALEKLRDTLADNPGFDPWHA
jgi:hypothetical protein